MIHGITVRLHVKSQTGTDAFNAPVYTETPIDVPNVLVGEPTAEDIVNDLQLYGKRIAYTLGIPKGGRPRLGKCDCRIFRQKISHLWRRDPGHRGFDPAALEQKGEGGTVWVN